MDRARFIVTAFHDLLPRYEPANPPTITAIAIGKIKVGSVVVAVILPAKPAIEFTRIKTTEAAAVAFTGAHFINKIKGVKKIPPPVPVRPAKNPIPAPEDTLTDGCISTISYGSFILNKNRTAENKRIAPTNISKISAGKFKYPPAKAAGIDKTTNGQVNFHEKWPAR